MSNIRITSTPSTRRFWAEVEAAHGIVRQWPAWRRAGINVSDRRSESMSEYHVYKDGTDHIVAECASALATASLAVDLGIGAETFARLTKEAYAAVAEPIPGEEETQDSEAAPTSSAEPHKEHP